MIKNNKITLNYYPDILEKIDFEDKYIYNESNEKSFIPKSFDNNFYSYFPDLDATQNKDQKIKYINTKKRIDLTIFINEYLQDNKILKLLVLLGLVKVSFCYVYQELLIIIYI